MAAYPVTKEPKIRIPGMIVLSFFIFTVGIIILGRVFYRSQITSINKEAQESLTAIANMRIGQIEQWHNERIGNAEQIRNNNPLLKSLKDYIMNANQPEVEIDIKKWMNYAAERFDFSGAFIYDTLLNSILAAKQSVSELPEVTKIVCGESLKDLNVRMTDLYRDGPSSPIAIDLVIPLVLNAKKQSRPFGVIVLRIDPTKTLFPLIQSWPTPSKSAETLLIRKEGDSVLYLNDLRHIPNSALNLRLLLADKNLPASKAINGFIGVVEGADYRKIPVVGYVTSLPGLNWFLVAKVDKEEIQAPLKRFSFISVFVVIVLILLVASVLVFWIRNQQFIESREHLRNELGRKQLDEALIISEARYRRLFEAARDGILILEAETGLIVDVNPYLVEMLGVPREQFLKKSIWEIGFFKDIAANKDKFLELQQKEYVRYEDLPLETSDGRKFHVEFVSNVYQVSGYNVIQCNIRDITRRKEMVDELNKHNSMINALLANLQIGVYMIEVPSGIPLLANESSFNLLGRGILPEASSDTIAKVYDLYKTGTDIPYPNEELPLIVAMSGVSKHVDDMEVKKPDGTRIALEVFGSPIRDNSGNIWASLVSFQDITERKQAELMLREEKERIRTILDQVGDPIFVKDNDHRITLANNAFYDIFCMDEKSVIGYTLAEAVPENERQLFLRVDRSVLDTGVADVREEELTVNGLTRTIITKKIRYIDESGKRFLVGSIHDITYRKKMEDELHESENKFRQTFDLSPVGIVMVGLDKRFIRTNKAFSASLGYEAEELIGKTISEVTHPDDLMIGMSDMGAIIKGEIETSQMQKRYLAKDGQIVWGEIIISLVRDNSGSPYYFLSIIQDITGRKLAEGKIENQIIELKRFNNAMIDREIKMIQLKQEINGYCKKLNLTGKYSIPDDFKQ